MPFTTDSKGHNRPTQWTARFYTESYVRGHIGCRHTLSDLCLLASVLGGKSNISLLINIFSKTKSQISHHFKTSPHNSHPYLPSLSAVWGQGAVIIHCPTYALSAHNNKPKFIWRPIPRRRETQGSTQAECPRLGEGRPTWYSIIAI